jgi:glycosyltransferase involved in cell wall biosynthesis
VPVIGSNRGAIPELVKEGYTGYLFDPNHPSHLMGKMQRFISEPTIIEAMRPSCLRKAKCFLPENILTQYLKVYQRALLGRRAL